jgi:hypothetical protein
MSQCRYISFDIKVNRASSMQIVREVTDKGVLPFFAVKLPPSDKRRFFLRLAPSGGKGAVWLWLNDGDIELSNLRVK